MHETSGIRMKTVCIETPYGRSDYARLCMRHSLSRGEAPVVPTLLYPQVLDYDVLVQSDLGFGASIVVGNACRLRAVYQDFGVTTQMRKAILNAPHGQPVEYRQLPKELLAQL